MKYIPSIAFEEMSGSAKGVTAAKMKNRKYIRNRGYGGSVRTQDQAKVKGIFKRLTTMWKTLTGPQRPRHRRQDLRSQPVHPPELLDCRLRRPAGGCASDPPGRREPF